MKKNKYIALLLTLLLPGLGYVYLGRKLLFGMFIILGSLGEMMWRFMINDGWVFNAFMLVAIVGFYGAILLDTWYTALIIEAERPPAAPAAPATPAASAKTDGNDGTTRS